MRRRKRGNWGITLLVLLVAAVAFVVFGIPTIIVWLLGGFREARRCRPGWGFGR